MANKSNLYSLKWRDAAKAVVTASLSAGVIALQQLIETGGQLNKDSLKAIGIVALGAGLGYLVKNFLTNSEDKIAVKEPEKPKY